MSYSGNKNRNSFAYHQKTTYIQCQRLHRTISRRRRDGIKWLNSQKRDYSTGVNILTRSGYKGFVAARLALQGEKPHTREKLEYEIRQMIKVWYHPDDPRFEDVDLADDAMPGNDGRSETVPEETAAAIGRRCGEGTGA